MYVTKHEDKIFYGTLLRSPQEPQWFRLEWLTSKSFSRVLAISLHDESMGWPDEDATKKLYTLLLVLISPSRTL